MRRVTLGLASVCICASGAKRGNPLTMIVSNLKKFDTNLKKAADADQKLYEKYQCSCKENIPAAEKGISESQDCIKKQTNIMKSRKALMEKLTKKIEDVEEKHGKNKSALADLLETLANDKASWGKMKEDLGKFIKSLDGALEKLHAGRAKLFLQTERDDVSEDLRVVRDFIENMPTSMQSTVASAGHEFVVQFLQQPSSDHYVSQAGSIIGILGNMHDNFKNDLKVGTEDHENMLLAVNEKRQVLDETISAQSQEINDANDDLAEAKKEASAAEKEKSNCSATLEAATTTLATEKEQCTANITEYEMRSAARSSEIKSIGKALDIFTSDKIRAVFAKLSPSFLQLSSSDRVSTELKKQYKQVSSIMVSAAKKFRDARFSLVANELAFLVTAKKRVFAPVCEKIHEFKSLLQIEKAEWIAFVDDCNTAKGELNSDIKTADDNIARLNLNIGTTNNELKAKQDEIDNNIAAIQAAKDGLGKATALRQEAHQDFLAEHANMEAAVSAMKEAIRILGNEYDSFIQADPEEFSDYEKQDGNGAISLIEDIKTKVETTAKTELDEENSDQTEYDGFVQATNTELRTLIDAKKSAEKAHADLEMKLDELTKSLDEQQMNLDTATENLDTKTKECRFRTNNFDAKVGTATQAGSIDKEVGVLEQCITILNCDPPKRKKKVYETQYP